MSTIASNQISVTDITDAYSVFMDNENYSFMGDVDGNVSGSMICNIKALRGNTTVNIELQSDASIKFYQNGTEIPSANLKFSAQWGGTSTARTVTISANTGAQLTGPIEARVPMTIDSTVDITKVITLTSSNTGATGQSGAAGKGISSVVTYFQRTNTNSAPTAGTSNPWSTTMTAPDASNHYLWAFDYYTYTDSSHSNSTVRLASQYNDATKWYSGTGITGTSTTPTIFSGSGITKANVDDQYLNTSTGNTYVCTTAGNAATAKWKYTGNIKGAAGQNGTNGTNGVDAITVTIESSASTVFKTNSASTDLTPVVRLGATTKTVTAGASCATCTINNVTYNVKWKKGSTDITTSKGKKNSSNQYTGVVTITGADVTNSEIITCNLETQS